jgi:hypothetical protein
MLPGFIGKVRRGRHQFKEIVGWYQLRETIPCSIADCGTPHNRGYVVAIQSGGTIGHTNIGHVCGRNEFGQAFELAHVAAEKFLDQQRLKQTVQDTLDELPEIKRRAVALLDDARGARWLQRAIGSLARACPPRVYEELYRRSARMETAITKARRRTDNDPPGPDGSHFGFITETVAVLDGVGCLTAPHPKEILEERILKPLVELRSLSAEAVLEKGATRRWFQAWRQGLAGEFETVERKLQQARLFFTVANLEKLRLLANSTEETARLEKLAWDEASGLITGIVPVTLSSMDSKSGATRTVSIDRYGKVPPGGWRKKKRRAKRGR